MQRLVDPLAEEADPARELLLRDREVDQDAAAGLRLAVVAGQLDEARGDAADRVGGAELGALAVGLPQARDEAGEDPERGARRALEEARKSAVG